MDDFGKALELTSDRIVLKIVYGARGDAFVRMEDFDRALADYESGAEFANGLLCPFDQRQAYALYRKGDTEGALAKLAEFSKVHFMNLNTSCVLGLHDIIRDQRERARSHFMRVLDYTPSWQEEYFIATEELKRLDAE